MDPPGNGGSATQGPPYRRLPVSTHRMLGAMRLEDLGWDERFAQEFAAWADVPDVRPGRVGIEFNHIFRVYTEHGEVPAVTAGRLKHRAASRSELPAVGDWVALRMQPGRDDAAIQGVLPRRSRFSRKAAGNVTDEQIVAANVDVVFIVMAMDGDFSVRRLERYLLLARESGASPAVLLTKPDRSDDPAARVSEVVAVMPDLPVHVLSPKFGEGLEQLSAYLTHGRTGALLGSSGVGKSTIINRLLGADVQRTRDTRETDSKGRHTTTHRELIVLPSGGLLIDTPGMRELQLWDVASAVQETFEDVETLAAGCHFTDCQHRDEPRCAVKCARDEGRLAPGRLESYLKLQDELTALARLRDERLQLEDKRRSKVMGKSLKARLKQKGRG
jgi:ribosome biogenesis GTPase / thiamine phosphate phosphatase